MAKSTATDPVNPFGDLPKMIEQFNLPGVDMRDRRVTSQGHGCPDGGKQGGTRFDE